MVHILVTANRLRLAAILDKGLQLQGWRTCMADTYDAVVGSVVHSPTNLVLVDADCFQASTFSLVRMLQHLQIISEFQTTTAYCSLADISLELWGPSPLVISIESVVLKQFQLLLLNTLRHPKIYGEYSAVSDFV